MKKDQVIKIDHIVLKPGTGLSWKNRRKIVGKFLLKTNQKIIYLKFQMSKKVENMCCHK